MVVICLPATALTGTEQERVATPSMCTVQAPHWAMPQPYLVPVRPIVSRNTHSRGVRASTSTLWDWPLMDSEIILILPFRRYRRGDKKCRARAGQGLCWDMKPR